MKTVLAFALVMLFSCAACHRAASPGDSSETSAVPASTPLSIEGATISASPNPIVGGPAEGATTISWDTHGHGPGQVYVSKDGASEQLVAGGATGNRTLKWIRTGLSYEFTLYQTKSHKLLAKVQAIHQR